MPRSSSTGKTLLLSKSSSWRSETRNWWDLGTNYWARMLSSWSHLVNRVSLARVVARKTFRLITMLLMMWSQTTLFSSSKSTATRISQAITIQPSCHSMGKDWKMPIWFRIAQYRITIWLSRTPVSLVRKVMDSRASTICTRRCCLSRLVTSLSILTASAVCSHRHRSSGTPPLHNSSRRCRAMRSYLTRLLRLSVIISATNSVGSFCLQRTSLKLPSTSTWARKMRSHFAMVCSRSQTRSAQVTRATYWRRLTRISPNRVTIGCLTQSLSF